MTTSNVTYQDVAELASHLSPEEQLRLVARVRASMEQTRATVSEAAAEISQLAALMAAKKRAELDAAHAGAVADDAPPGSAAAILCAMREPPHLTTEDVDALEQAVADGKVLVRHEGVFDSEDSE